MTIDNLNNEAALSKGLALAQLVPPVFVGPALRAGKTKRPTTPHGFKDYSADPSVIVALFTKYGGNQVAIWPGPSGILIEDIDVGGDNGFETVLRLQEQWVSNLHYRTPSGGEHHGWMAPSPAPGPAAPIKGFPGIDRRSGDSLCLWYGPVPSQTDWDAMRAQTTPSWLLSNVQSRSGSSQSVTPASWDEVQPWIDSLTDGDPIVDLLTDTSHYGLTIRALVRLVEHTRKFPTWPGARATFEELADGYINSTVATSEDLGKKVLDMLRWALGATSNVEDLTWAYDRWIHFGATGLTVPSSSIDSKVSETQDSPNAAGTVSTRNEAPR